MKNILPIILLVVSIGCEEEKSSIKRNKTVIARINDRILYQADVEKITANITESADKIQRVNDYIRAWTLQELIILEAEKRKEYNKIAIEKKVQAYRNALIRHDFIEKQVAKQLATNVSKEEIQKCYNSVKSDFILSHNIVQGRFIVVPNKSPNIKAIRPLISSVKVESLKKLESYCKQYATHYWLAHDQWIIWDDILRISHYRPISNKTRLLISNKFIHIRGPTHTYFFKIDNYKLAKSLAPLGFVEPKIKAIICYKRQLALIKSIEEKILDEAKRNDKYTIYTS